MVELKICDPLVSQSSGWWLSWLSCSNINIIYNRFSFVFSAKPQNVRRSGALDSWMFHSDLFKCLSLFVSLFLRAPVEDTWGMYSSSGGVSIVTLQHFSCGGNQGLIAHTCQAGESDEALMTCSVFLLCLFVFPSLYFHTWAHLNTHNPLLSNHNIHNHKSQKNTLWFDLIKSLWRKTRNIHPREV